MNGTVAVQTKRLSPVWPPDTDTDTGTSRQTHTRTRTRTHTHTPLKQTHHSDRQTRTLPPPPLRQTDRHTTHSHSLAVLKLVAGGAEKRMVDCADDAGGDGDAPGFHSP